MGLSEIYLKLPRNPDLKHAFPLASSFPNEVVLCKKYHHELKLNDDLAVLDKSIKDDVFAEVETAVGQRVNAIIEPKSENEHEVGALNFLRPAQVSKVQEERQLLASYGDVQFDCNCATGKRIDFQACEPNEGRDVSSTFKIIRNLFLNLILSLLDNLS